MLTRVHTVRAVLFKHHGSVSERKGNSICKNVYEDSKPFVFGACRLRIARGFVQIFKEDKMKKTIALILTLMFGVLCTACSNSSAPSAIQSAPQTDASKTEFSRTEESKAEASQTVGDPYAAEYPITGNIVYFKDTLNWGAGGKTIYVFYWSSHNDKLVQWPGSRMKSLGNNVYSYEVPNDAEYLIFDMHPDSMTKEGQTRDIPYDGSVRRFQCSDKQDEMKASYVTDWDGKEIGTNQIDDGSGANQLIVNVGALKSIEEKDTFPVKFTSYKVDVDSSGAADFIFNVKNNTDKTLSQVKFFILAYNPDLHARIIDVGPAVDLGIGDDAYIQEYTTEDGFSLKPGDTGKITVHAEKKTISDCKAIVSSYTADGKTVYNSTAYEWYKNAYTNKVVDNSKIFNKLDKAFGASIEITKDERGAVTMDTTVLFDYDSYKLSDKGKASLKKVIDAYADTVSAEDGTILVKKITVEGHTDTDGTHEYNQKLSENRAKAVLDYCVGLHPEFKSVMVAKGCADENPVKKADGTVDMAASRRVCFVAE